MKSVVRMGNEVLSDSLESYAKKPVFTSRSSICLTQMKSFNGASKKKIFIKSLDLRLGLLCLELRHRDSFIHACDQFGACRA